MRPRDFHEAELKLYGCLTNAASTHWAHIPDLALWPSGVGIQRS